MAGPRLTVPESALGDLRCLASGSSDDLRAVADGLEKAEPCVYWHEMIPAVVEASGTDPAWTEEVLEAVWGLGTVRSLLDLEPDEFVEGLTVALGELREEQWTETDRENWSANLADIRRLLDPGTAFSVAAKAAGLLMEQPLVLDTARILTDMRPVFDDPAASLRGFVCFHTLVLRCREGDRSRVLHVAVDDRDLDTLREQLDRACRKSRILRWTCADKGIGYISTAAELPEGGDEDGPDADRSGQLHSS